MIDATTFDQIARELRQADAHLATTAACGRGYNGEPVHARVRGLLEAHELWLNSGRPIAFGLAFAADDITRQIHGRASQCPYCVDLDASLGEVVADLDFGIEQEIG